MLPICAIHVSWRVHFPELVEALERRIVWAEELEACGERARSEQELEDARAIAGELGWGMTPS